MKRLSALSLLLLSVCCFAQYTTQEIKIFKISKITTLSVTKGDETIQRHETLYDEYGNDTAEFNGDEVYRRTKYEYNSKKQVVSRTRYSADGKETETAVYDYKPDGIVILSNTDKNFGMTDLTYWDKTGRMTKTVSPDGTERAHTYNTKGKLLTIKSKSNNGGVVTDIQYTYNAKSQILKEVSKGDYKWTSVFSYDNKGMIAKVKRNSVTDGVADPEITTTYEYEFAR
jgi:YD repeat-containing protein